MILSRHIARRRIAAGVRPGWLAAWAPVAVDALALSGLMALIFWLARDSVATWPIWASVTVLVLAFFIPVQIVLITSAFWAARSRWVDHAPPDPMP